ncbi:putative RNA-binding Zn ribbon-like protein [Lipingzhangella halophila]|uniref:Putative RNA-binding Zn ribbon-like protein n=1 Tax=Lipingzhangella halophila TaxID=1783352 RepID=A0A7W7RIZ7_9ACTN|nr:ABATE domain-containing protein [Lipingzhangella halophila]MBB4932867.1 putative RNA-binding Zn ribbon-like protein [Lipingzhangella halophila]
MGSVFVSGRSSLDLAGTLKWRRGESEELLAEPADLGRWAVEAALVDEPPEVAESGLRQGKELRETIYRLASGWPATADRQDAELLSMAAAVAPPVVDLDQRYRIRRSGPLEAVLSAVARDAIELLGGSDIGRMHECARPECTRLFVDSSRGKPRRWCGMAECGNRIKAANYRRRQRTTSPSTR